MSQQASSFTIAAAQSSSVAGDVSENVRRHVAFVRAARDLQANVVVFPELSLTGYEPTIASRAAIDRGDTVIQPLRDLSSSLGITILAGCPIRSPEQKPYLGAFIFRAGRPVVEYRKRFLHGDEVDFFTAGNDTVVCESHGQQIGVAICADISNPCHSADASDQAATVYAAGVAMTPDGVAAAEARMSRYAGQHGLIAVMANYASSTGGYEIAGRSAIWKQTGEVVAQANADGESLVMAGVEGEAWTSRVERL